jgi:hypothetical protein
LTYSDLIFLLQTNNQRDAVLECFPPYLALRRGLAIDFPAEQLNRRSLVYFQAEYGRLLDAAGRTREAKEARAEAARVAPETPSVSKPPEERRFVK